MKTMPHPELWKRLKSIELLALDFDGVLTDGFVYVSDYGVERVRCSRRDSAGLKMVKAAGIDVIVISQGENPTVRHRCKKMGITYFYSTVTADGHSKLDILRTYAEQNDIDPEHIAYVGDDLNDCDVMQYVGFPVAVADGVKEVYDIADYIIPVRGGDHAVRHLCDKILDARDIDPRMLVR